MYTFLFVQPNTGNQLNGSQERMGHSKPIISLYLEDNRGFNIHSCSN